MIYIGAGGTDRFGNMYIYKVMDWSNPLLAFGLAIAAGFLTMIMHFIIVGLYYLRSVFFSNDSL